MVVHFVGENSQTHKNMK